MEAHNGLSAKIVEEAGFKGIWASGLSISASLGVRDNNEASWTQVLEVVEFMCDATTVPILLDGDTGYGNFNNMRRLVKKLEQRGVAGVCIEDKIFPKTNSFIASEVQPLADIDEFCGKIKAGKDAQSDENFCIISRIEAFIAGWGLDEAIKRAEAYRQAGADAILIHSKKNNSSDIEIFMREWGGRHPVVIVPTKYYSTPTDRFRELGISLVIWANHPLRASIKAMQKIVRQIYLEESLINVEDKIAPLSEVFRLQGDEELRIAEKLYLPKRGVNVKAIILAASQGKELGMLTDQKPKAMIEINGKPILVSLLNILNELGIKDITVVRGYKKEIIVGPNFNIIDNDDYDLTKDLYSLYLAKEKLSGNSIIIYGDSIFRKHILLNVLEATGDIIVVVDADVKNDGKKRDYVKCSRKYTNDFFNMNIYLKEVVTTKDAMDMDGEWVGIVYVTEKGSELIKDTIKELSEHDYFKSLSITDMLNILSARHFVSVVYTKGGWIDVDDAYDIEKAGQFYS